jgi:hypothetical protein
MNDDIKGQGGAFEIDDDGVVQRTEGTAEAPLPLPPTEIAIGEATDRKEE